MGSKLVPEIRFPKLHGEWKQSRLGELIEISSASRVHKNEWKTTGVRFFRSSDVVSKFYGKKNTPAFISYSLYDELSKKSGIVQPGDILVTGGGSIGIPYLVKDQDPLYFKDADLIWLKSANEINGSFLYYYFETKQLRRYISSITHIGTISHYTIEQAKETPIILPERVEQTLVGDFFRQLDDSIALHQQELTTLKQTKQGFLQKMFPKEGETVPEVRFPGFTEEWGQFKLGNIAKFNPRSHLPDQFEYVDLESVDGINLITHRTEKKETAPSRAQRLAEKGDVFYQTVRPYQRNNYIFELPFDNYVFSTGYAQMRPKIDSYFLLTRLQEDGFVSKVLDRCTGTSYPAINSTDLAQIEISVPMLKEEQTKIGKFFKQLDETITLQQRELDALIDTKKAFLQKMFI